MIVDVDEAAERLGIDPSRVRQLLLSGGLSGRKLAGRWIVDLDSVLARERGVNSRGRPLNARNAWALLMLASGEEPAIGIDGHTSWRMRKALEHSTVWDMRPRLSGRAAVTSMWALPGELEPLRGDAGVVLTGTSAAVKLGRELLAPDTVDVYLPAATLPVVAAEYGLEPAAPIDANVTVRVVADDAWALDGRQIAPAAAVGLDLATSPDSRASRVGRELLEELAHRP